MARGTRGNLTEELDDAAYAGGRVCERPAESVRLSVGHIDAVQRLRHGAFD